jgi:hypothetical protein
MKKEKQATHTTEEAKKAEKQGVVTSTIFEHIKLNDSNH